MMPTKLTPTLSEQVKRTVSESCCDHVNGKWMLLEHTKVVPPF